MKSVLAILALLVAIYVPSHFSRHLWNPDEPRYVEVSREMRQTGDWFLPRLNGEIYGEKPPLYFWLVDAGERATGSYILGARAVSALAVALAALFTALLGAHLFDRRTGVFAAAIFASTVLVVEHGQKGLIDPTFACLVSGATYALVRARGETRTATASPERDAPGPGSRLGFALLAALFMGAGTLAKGPLALLLPAIGASAIGIPRRGWRGIPAGALLLGLAVSAALGFGWLHLAAREAGAKADWYWERMVFRQTVGRLSDSWSHEQPPWYYLEQLGWTFLPWLLLAPAAALAAWRARRDEPVRLGPLLWFAAVFFLFSAVSGKRPGYLLPIAPAFALVIGRHLAGLATASHPGTAPEPESRLDRAGEIGAGILFAGLAAALAAFPPLAGRLPGLAAPRRQDMLREFVGALPSWTAPAAFAAAAALTLLALALFGAFGRLRPARVVAVIATGAAVLSLAAHAVVIPALDPQKSARALGEQVAREHSPGERLVLCPHEFDGVVNFYTGALHYDVLREPGELRAAADAPGRLWVVAHHYFFEKLEPALRDRFDVRGAHRVGRRIMYFAAEKEGP